MVATELWIRSLIDDLPICSGIEFSCKAKKAALAEIAGNMF